MADETKFATTPKPPYYAVIFTNQRTPGDDGYHRMLDAMLRLAAQQPGYLGRESARDGDGFGTTVSYGRDADSVKNWKRVAEHQAAQLMGHRRWYTHYELRVARVERAYAGPEGRSDSDIAGIGDANIAGVTLD